MQISVAPNLLATIGAETVRNSELFRRWEADLQPGHEPQEIAVFAVGKEPDDDRYRMLLGIAYRVENGRRWVEPLLLVDPVVDVLTVVSDGHRKYALIVEQTRPTVGRSVRSNPSGRVDGALEALTTTLERELAEEAPTSIKWGEPKNLNWLVTRKRDPLLVSPGITNEQVTFFAVEATVPRQVITELRGQAGGNRHEGEATVVWPVLLEDVPAYLVEHGLGDAKTLMGWLMYMQAVHSAA